MKRDHTFKYKFTFVVLSIILSMIFHSSVYANAEDQLQTLMDLEEHSSWIIKWNGEMKDPQLYENSIVTDENDELQISVVQPIPKVDIEDWVLYWENSDFASYIQPNQRVQIEAVPNDPLYQLQDFMKVIGVEEAWNVQQSSTGVTIAVVDTGVDLVHPDLKGNLVSGINLIDDAKQPQDDNGHGTRVAGVIGAMGNNSRGVSGVLWKASIMPIKALGKNGYGDESKLGAGIRYAVDQGADIIVLSVGLYKKSTFLSDIVTYAESKGVLVVAASGNDGQMAVKYPAAYPSVLAVGGMASNKQLHSLSNYGQEIDVIAPWRVYTTSLDGGFAYEDGTSMAAPQVAAVAALIKAKHPNMKPYEIRNQIRNTAESIHSKVWNDQSGYGLLRADKALTIEPLVDINEPNNSMEQSTQLPVGGMVSGSIVTQSDNDWFNYLYYYTGTLQIEVNTVATTHRSRLRLVYYENAGAEPKIYEDLSKKIVLPANKNNSSFFRIESKSSISNTEIRYHIHSKFLIQQDDYEDNDRQYKATILPSRDQQIVGNFHQVNDVDWFAIQFTQPGSFRANLSTNSYRIDPELLVVKEGESAASKRPVDSEDAGKTEYLKAFDVLPGKYYIRVRNSISLEESLPVEGQYTLNLFYSQKLLDPNEPNNRSYQATTVNIGTPYKGIIEKSDDEDWFLIKVEKESLVSIDLLDIPNTRMMSLTLLDSQQNEISLDVNKIGQQKLNIDMVLQKGIYYVKLKANEPFQNQFYQLNIKSTPLKAGLMDIEGHWAESQILALVENNIVTGYGDYQFKPNRHITRAEGVMMLSNAFTPEENKDAIEADFKDVSAGHWAYEAIRIGHLAEWVSGYPDDTFRPSQSLTRVEMTVLFAKVLDIEIQAKTAQVPFKDIPDHHWALEILTTMKQAGWINGYPDGTFKPNQTATRAEFSYLLQQLREHLN